MYNIKLFHCCDVVPNLRLIHFNLNLRMYCNGLLKGGGYSRFSITNHLQKQILKPSLTIFTKFDYRVPRTHDSQKLLWHVVVFHFWRFWPSRASRQVSKTKISPPQLKNKVLRKPPCFPPLCLHTFPCHQCRCCSPCKSFLSLSRILRGKRIKKILAIAFISTQGALAVITV